MNGALTIQQAADKLGVHYNTIWRLIQSGRLSAFKVGWVWRIPDEAIERLAGAKSSGNKEQGGLECETQ